MKHSLNMCPRMLSARIKQAVKEALENADEDDVILAFGSFSPIWGKSKGSG